MSGAKPRNRNPITTLAPTATPMPMACTDRINQNEKTESDSRIQILRPVPSIALKIEKITGFQRYFYFCPAAGSSYGAPVPVEPRNNLRPSARVISLPFALCDPSLDWYPSTTTLVPGSRASFLKPRRNKTFGVPASKAQFSTLPSGFFTSTSSQTWGLVHCILVTVPSNLTGLLASNSAAKAWWAESGAATAVNNKTTTALTKASFVRIG